MTRPSLTKNQNTHTHYPRRYYSRNWGALKEENNFWKMEIKWKMNHVIVQFTFSTSFISPSSHHHNKARWQEFYWKQAQTWGHVRSLTHSLTHTLSLTFTLTHTLRFSIVQTGREQVKYGIHERERGCMRKENNKQDDFLSLPSQFYQSIIQKKKNWKISACCVFDSTQNPNTSSYEDVPCPCCSVSVMHIPWFRGWNEN